ncbi:uncharacterized protein LOC123549701 [Mercenaria mercenaria]|uniref:uncharacterized protein LOC123549701 n=1 Tax=Mercenaria mercenaria TaxID=6596 RepID=UPI00234F33D5|nr:uncharacterized protein LOC123549701 [Mercenaria mercenaria]
MHGYIVVLLCYFTFTNSLDSGCETINGILFFDKSIRSKEEQLQQALRIWKHVKNGLPENSEIDLNNIGKEVEHISSVLHHNNDGWLDKLNEHSLDAIDTYGTIPSHVIERKINSYFSASKYKLVAEIVVLFVSSSTSLDNIPLSLLKKKTIVVVFGDSASQQWKTVSSRDDHLFLVNRTENLGTISERLINAACIDSSYYCDTDQYSTKKGAKCKDCIGNACSKNPTEEISNTCKSRCPFFRRTVPEKAVITHDFIKENERTARVPDHKPIALKVTAIVKYRSDNRSGSFYRLCSIQKATTNTNAFEH